MKRFLLNLFWLFLCTGTKAQNNFPPAYTIITDTASFTPLPDSCWQILEDKDGRLGFEAVSHAPLAEQFHHYTAKSPKPDRSMHAYWVRYVLKNSMDHVAKISVSSTSNQFGIYSSTGNGIFKHEVNGNLIPWSKQDGLKGYGAIPFEVGPGGQLVVYEWKYNKYRSRAIEVGFKSTEKLMQEIYVIAETGTLNAIHDTFIFGVLAFASLFIFFFYLIIREKVYLYFSLYLLSLAIGRFNINYEMYFVFFKEFPVLYYFIFQAIWFFAVFFLVQFIRHLLNTKLYFPRWNKFLIGLNFLYAITYLVFMILLISGVLSIAVYTTIGYEQWFLALSVPVSFLLTLKWFKSNKVLTWIILPLQSIWSIGWVYVEYYQNNPDQGVGDWLVTNWYGFETILLSGLVISFSWILLQRFIDLKKQVVQKELEKEMERSSLIEKQKMELEEQVTKRTAELNQTVVNLKSTQSQLIQSEKMASLGELTAGIAHEIQNPLNFVNNFSEVNKELLAEMNEEIEKGNYEEVRIDCEGSHGQ